MPLAEASNERFVYSSGLHNHSEAESIYTEKVASHCKSLLKDGLWHEAPGG